MNLKFCILSLLILIIFLSGCTSANSSQTSASEVTTNPPTTTIATTPQTTTPQTTTPQTTTPQTTTSQTTTETTNAERNSEDWKEISDNIIEAATEADFDQIYRYPNDYSDKSVFFSGKVIAVAQYEEDPTSFRVGLCQDEDSSKFWFVEYSTKAGGPQLREGDLVKVYALVLGTKTSIENNTSYSYIQATSIMVEFE